MKLNEEFRNNPERMDNVSWHSLAAGGTFDRMGWSKYGMRLQYLDLIVQGTLSQLQMTVNVQARFKVFQDYKSTIFFSTYILL